MNEIEYERMQEDAAIGEQMMRNLTEVLESFDAESLNHLRRLIYRYSDCGASLGVILMDGRVLYDKLETVQLTDVAGFTVSSIVEGVEQTTTTYEVDLRTYERPEDATNALEEAISEVEREASEIWNATHGCEECAKLWHREDVYTNEYGDEFEGGDGATPVHPDCPECGGHGIVI